MNAVGLFEAKTKFSEICERVAARGVAVVVTRRGKPLVTIAPIPSSKGQSPSVWDRRARLEKQRGRFKDDFTLSPRATQTWRNPLDD
jgi:prevent-host-death family protein